MVVGKDNIVVVVVGGSSTAVAEARGRDVASCRSGYHRHRVVTLGHPVGVRSLLVLAERPRCRGCHPVDVFVCSFCETGIRGS